MFELPAEFTLLWYFLHAILYRYLQNEFFFLGGETIEKEEGVYCGMCSLISTICWFILKSEVGGRTDRSGFEARDSNNKVITAAPLDGQVT